MSVAFQSLQASSLTGIQHSISFTVDCSEEMLAVWRTSKQIESSRHGQSYDCTAYSAFILNFPSKIQLWSSTAFVTYNSQLLRDVSIYKSVIHLSANGELLHVDSMFSSIYPAQFYDFQEMEPPLRNYSWQWQAGTMYYIDSKKKKKKACLSLLLFFSILPYPLLSAVLTPCKYFCACAFLCHHHFLKKLTSSQSFSCICTEIHRVWLFLLLFSKLLSIS